MAERETRSGVGTVERGTEGAARVADVLLAVGRSVEPVGVSELSRMLNLSKTVVFRIVKTLESKNLLHFDEATRTYSIGESAITLGNRSLNFGTLLCAAEQALRKLPEATGETATLSALVGNSLVYLNQVSGPNNPVAMVDIRRPLPLHAGSSAKAILANAPSRVREAVLNGRRERIAKRTIVDRATLLNEIEVIARRGLSFSQGERQDHLTGISAPLFSYDGRVIGSLGLCGPTSRIDGSRMVEYGMLVRRYSSAINEALKAPHRISTNGSVTISQRVGR